METIPASIAQAIATNREAARADNTRRALRNGWARWQDWAAAQGRPLLPADPVDLELFLVGHLATACRYGARTIAQSLWAINQRHREAGLEPPGKHPAVLLAMQGLWRQLGAGRKQQKPLTIAQIARMDFPATLRGLRDKSLLLLGFAAALRRSELVALDVADVTISPAGLTLRIRRSKTDQLGIGADVQVPRSERFPGFCPVEALLDWLAASGIAEGALFRSVQHGRARHRLAGVDVNRVVKACAEAAGLGLGYGGHSLRAGCATWLAANGVGVPDIARHGRWKSYDTVLAYCRGDTARAVRGTY